MAPKQEIGVKSAGGNGRSPAAALAAMAFGTLALATLTALNTGCDVGPNGRKVQYMPDMADSPAPKAQKEYLDPPVGAVAMNAMFYPKTVEEAEKVLTTPDAIKNDPDTAKKGKQLFETFCIPCHGIDAHGVGTLNVSTAPHPPDITSDIYAKKGDGFFFYRITFGSASTLMPGYGHAISVHERWQIIAHVRELQKANAK